MNNEFISIYEELSLTEAYTSPYLNITPQAASAAEQTYKDTVAKNKQFDTDAYHQAYDKILDAAGFLNLFGSDGLLQTKGSYSAIKNAPNKKDPAVVALKACWEHQWGTDYRTGKSIAIPTVNQVNAAKQAQAAKLQAAIASDAAAKEEVADMQKDADAILKAVRAALSDLSARVLAAYEKITSKKLAVDFYAIPTMTKVDGTDYIDRLSQQIFHLAFVDANDTYLYNRPRGKVLARARIDTNYEQTIAQMTKTVEEVIGKLYREAKHNEKLATIPGVEFMKEIKKHSTNYIVTLWVTDGTWLYQVTENEFRDVGHGVAVPPNKMPSDLKLVVTKVRIPDDYCGHSSTHDYVNYEYISYDKGLCDMLGIKTPVVYGSFGSFPYSTETKEIKEPKEYHYFYTSGDMTNFAKTTETTYGTD